MFGKNFEQYNEDVTVDGQSVTEDDGDENFGNELLNFHHTLKTVYLRFFSFSVSQGFNEPPEIFTGIRVFLKKDLNIWFDFFTNKHTVQYRDSFNGNEIYVRFIKI